MEARFYFVAMASRKTRCGIANKGEFPLGSRASSTCLAFLMLPLLGAFGESAELLDRLASTVSMKVTVFADIAELGIDRSKELVRALP